MHKETDMHILRTDEEDKEKEVADGNVEKDFIVYTSFFCAY